MTVGQEKIVPTLLSGYCTSALLRTGVYLALCLSFNIFCEPASKNPPATLCFLGIGTSQEYKVFLDHSPWEKEIRGLRPASTIDL